MKKTNLFIAALITLSLAFSATAFAETTTHKKVKKAHPTTQQHAPAKHAAKKHSTTTQHASNTKHPAKKKTNKNKSHNAA